MAYNEALAERIRILLAGKDGITERKMFGGIAFMAPGGMVCGIIRDDFMARVGSNGYEDALARKGARPMDFAGRVSRGMVFVAPEGYEGALLDDWVRGCYAVVQTLPVKPAKAAPTRRHARGRERPGSA